MFFLMKMLDFKLVRFENEAYQALTRIDCYLQIKVGILKYFYFVSLKYI